MAMVQHDGSDETLNNKEKGPSAEEEDDSAGVAAVTVEDAAEVTAGAASPVAKDEPNVAEKNGTAEKGATEEGEEGGAVEKKPPRHQYSKAELLKLRHDGLCRRRPPCLDPAYNNLSGMWDPERWFLGKRRGGSTPPVAEDSAGQAGGTAAAGPHGGPRSKRERLDSEGGSAEPLGGPKRRNPPDPKERLAREERDDLVLSPQRRSFGTGCHVTQPRTQVTGHSDGPNKDQDGLLHREPSRRIGSGRILRDQRDWDSRGCGYGARRFDDNTGGGHSGGRYGTDRRRGRDDRLDEEEEPEWFVGGPTSQHDTIELVGFEEDPDGARRPGRRSRRSRDLARKQNNGPDLSSQEAHPPNNATTASTAIVTTATTTTTTAAGVTADVSTRAGTESQDSSGTSTALSLADTTKSNDVPVAVTSTPRTASPTLWGEAQAAPAAPPKQDGFDFNDIFKADWCPRFLLEEPLEEQEGVVGGSRFSQWFRRESPPPEQQQLCPDNQPRANDLVNRVLGSGGNEASLRVPTPESYFTPISPALPRDRGDYRRGNPMAPPGIREDGQKNILDILMDANINVEAHLLNGDAAKTAQLREHALSGKAKSVEELEADLKHVVLGHGPAMHLAQQQQQQHQQLQQQQQQQQQQQHQRQQHLQGLLNKLGGHGMAPAVPERALLEEDLLRANSYGPHPGLHGGRGVDPRGGGAVLAQLLRSKPRASPSGQEMLVKMLTAGVGPHPSLGGPPLSPTTNQAPPPHLLAHDQMAAAAVMLRQQQQQQQQQHQQQQEMLNSLLKAPLVTTQRPSPTQQLGLLTPGAPGGSCQSPLPPDPRRVPSPLVFGQHVSPIPPAGNPAQVTSGQSPNTLQVHSAGLRPRVPSPQELAVHTQSILQTALIKKILEDQKHKENLRKQHEAQRTRSPTVPQGGSNRGGSPSKGLSPTMAAFTPTSVMRKMHLERQDHPKDKPGRANGPSEQECLGNGTAVPQRTNLGRAILKGPDHKGGLPPQPYQPHPPVLRSDVDMVAKVLEQQRLLGLQQQQQQHQHQQRVGPQGAPPPGVMGLLWGGPASGPTPAPAMKLPPLLRPTGLGPPPNANKVPPVAAPRALKGPLGVQQRGAPVAGGGASLEMLHQALNQGLHPLTFQQLLLGTQPPHSGGHPFGGPSPQHLSQQHPYVGSRDGKPVPHGGLSVPGGGGVGGAGVVGGTSPANLTKWFGSEVLYQPTMPPVPHQKALLVEDVERQQQQATAVKN